MAIWYSRFHGGNNISAHLSSCPLPRDDSPDSLRLDLAEHGPDVCYALHFPENETRDNITRQRQLMQLKRPSALVFVTTIPARLATANVVWPTLACCDSRPLLAHYMVCAFPVNVPARRETRSQLTHTLQANSQDRRDQLAVPHVVHVHLSTCRLPTRCIFPHLLKSL